MKYVYSFSAYCDYFDTRDLFNAGGISCHSQLLSVAYHRCLASVQERTPVLDKFMEMDEKMTYCPVDSEFDGDEFESIQDARKALEYMIAATIADQELDL